MIELKKSNILIVMTAAMAFWGANWTCAKILEPLLPVHVLVFYRFFFAALGFLPIIFFQGISFKIPKKAIPIMVLCSAMMGVYQYLFFKGLHVGLAGAGGVLVTTLNPVMTFALMAILKKKWLSHREWLGSGLGLISTLCFLKLWALDFTGLFDSGNLFFLGAAFSWAILTILSQNVGISSLLYNFYAFGLVAPLFLIGHPLKDLGLVLTMNWVFWVNMGFIVIFGTIFSTTFYFMVAQTHGAKKAASYIFLVPVMAMATSMVVLKESPSIATIMGGCFALTGVYVLNRQS